MRVPNKEKNKVRKIEDLKIEYDKLQKKYGAKELDSIYNGGCENNPDVCFVFMNPTGKNIASDKSWKGRKSPWLGTKNIWKLFNKVDLLSDDTYKVFPVYYPVGNGIFNIDKSIEDIKWIIGNLKNYKEVI
mgnify:CR=1 FL=1